MKLGKYFTLSEFTRSKAASKLGLDNTPTKIHLMRIQLLVAEVLDPLREAAGLPMDITSGYRSQAVNAATPNSSATSQHMLGEAADIKVRGLTAQDLVAEILRLDLDFDQAIWYDPKRGGHVHVSYTARRKNRREVLHAPAGGGYVAADTST